MRQIIAVLLMLAALVASGCRSDDSSRKAWLESTDGRFNGDYSDR